MVTPADLTPERLLAEVDELLDDPQALSPPLTLDGLPAVAAELNVLLHEHAAGAAQRSSEPRLTSTAAGRRR